MALQGLGFREQMEHLAEALEPLPPADRRPVYELVRWIAGEWIGNHGPSHRALVIEVAADEAGLRMLICCDPDLEDQEAFWPALVAGAPPYLVRRWALDRRDSAGAWFELERVATASAPE